MFTPIYDKPGEPTMYMGTADDVAGNDAAINAALPNADVGTMVTVAGYRTIKQKDLTGEWVTL